MKFLIPPVTIAGALLVLVGCAIMAPRFESQTFALDPGNPPTAPSRLPGGASVEFAEVEQPFAGGQFIYQLGEARWETDPYNRWVNSPGEMFTDLMRSWLRQSRAFDSVSIPGSGQPARYRIFWSVSSLVIDFRDPSAPEAVVQIQIEAHDQVSQTDLLPKATFEGHAPVAERTPEAFVSAWNSALRQAFTKVSNALQ